MSWRIHVLFCLLTFFVELRVLVLLFLGQTRGCSSLLSPQSLSPSQRYEQLTVPPLLQWNLPPFWHCIVSDKYHKRKLCLKCLLSTYIVYFNVLAIYFIINFLKYLSSNSFDKVPRSQFCVCRSDMFLLSTSNHLGQR